MIKNNHLNKVKYDPTDEELKELEDLILEYNDSADYELLKKAYIYTKEKHKNQKRKSGEPYYIHPFSVAKIATKMNLDIDAILACLLHDIVEDTDTSLEELEKQFGSPVMQIVDGLTKLAKYQFKSTEEAQAENFRKMLIAMSSDIRVILIKLADRLHNMRTLNHMPREKQIRIAKETENIYAPLAHRLGISWLKIELEDLILKYLEPEMYDHIYTKIEKETIERAKYTNEVVDLIKNALTEYQISADVSGRFKHYYSIAKKIKERHLEFEQIYDLLAFRIILEDVPQCYEALGTIHSFWKPVPGRFKDYIAMPKPNNYQSLHTTVIGPYGKKIEIQIRTQEMHDIAEHGIAAHWMYKENKMSDKERKKVQWIQELLDLQKETANPGEFLNTLKTDLFADEIFVFTPEGDVVSLPYGSTPLDFAYSIHTELGHSCTGATINEKIVPLRHKLDSGDTVSILKSKTQHPKKDWLSFVKTGKARSKIKQYLNTEEREKAFSFGKDLLTKEFRKNSLKITQLIKDGELEKIARKFNLKNTDELIVSVGYGKVLPKSIIDEILEETATNDSGKIKNIFDKVTNLTTKSRSAVRVSGMDDILIKFAKCCSPIHGEPIIGFITRGQGITIHARDCHKVPELSEERLIDVEWAHEPKDHRIARIRIETGNTAGLLLKMSKIFAENGADVIGADIKTTELERVVCFFDVKIKNLNHLNAVLTKLRKTAGIYDVSRVRGKNSE